ncbi:MAG: hypothetical protein LBI75_02775 [Brucellaceae bacterium]|jgi:hypothetical protein|nr:hypothetical protein [Brucellaceae bacterium]
MAGIQHRIYDLLKHTAYKNIIRTAPIKHGMQEILCFLYYALSNAKPVPVFGSQMLLIQHKSHGFAIHTGLIAVYRMMPPPPACEKCCTIVPQNCSSKQFYTISLLNHRYDKNI